MGKEEEIRSAIKILEEEMEKVDHRTKRVLSMSRDYLQKRLEFPNGTIQIKLYVERGRETMLIDEVDSDWEFLEEQFTGRDEDDLGF